MVLFQIKAVCTVRFWQAKTSITGPFCGDWSCPCTMSHTWCWSIQAFSCSNRQMWRCAATISYFLHGIIRFCKSCPQRKCFSVGTIISILKKCQAFVCFITSMVQYILSQTEEHQQLCKTLWNNAKIIIGKSPKLHDYLFNGIQRLEFFLGFYNWLQFVGWLTKFRWVCR